MSRCTALVFVVLGLLSGQAAQAVDRYEIAYDLSIQDLAGDFAHNRVALEPFIKGAKTTFCPSREWAGYRCYQPKSQEQPIVFAAPYPPVAPPKGALQTADDFGWMFTSNPEIEGLSWVPAKEVKDGQRLVKQWREMAGSNAVFGCGDTGCMVYAQTFSRSAPAGAEVLSQCWTTVGAKGPPSFCFPVAVSLKNRSWIRATLATSAEGGEGRPDFKVIFVLSEKMDTKGISSAVQTVLTGKPWELSTETLPAGFRASADRRVSPIDGTLRESLSVRVDVTDEHYYSTAVQKTLPIIKFEFSTTLYVNDYNTSQAVDWHLPTPEVQQAYVKRLQQSIKDGVAGACPDVYWIDSVNATCGISDSSVRSKLKTGL